jgi:hypothetical protein
MTLLWLGFCGSLRPCTSLYRRSALQSRYSYLFRSFGVVVRASSIFEGTSEIQSLVVARLISGLPFPDPSPDGGPVGAARPCDPDRATHL